MMIRVVWVHSDLLVSLAFCLKACCWFGFETSFAKSLTKILSVLFSQTMSVKDQVTQPDMNQQEEKEIMLNQTEGYHGEINHAMDALNKAYIECNQLIDAKCDALI